MITRLVKMTFLEDQLLAFEDIFHSMAPHIRNFEGCLSAELHKDITDTSVYFTISTWESTDSLENYRSSEIFKTTWARVKPMFSEKARAWTLEPAGTTLK